MFFVNSFKIELNIWTLFVNVNWNIDWDCLIFFYKIKKKSYLNLTKLDFRSVQNSIILGSAGKVLSRRKKDLQQTSLIQWTLSDKGAQQQLAKWAALKRFTLLKLNCDNTRMFMSYESGVSWKLMQGGLARMGPCRLDWLLLFCLSFTFQEFLSQLWFVWFSLSEKIASDYWKWMLSFSDLNCKNCKGIVEV